MALRVTLAISLGLTALGGGCDRDNDQPTPAGARPISSASDAAEEAIPLEHEGVKTVVEVAATPPAAHKPERRVEEPVNWSARRMQEFALKYREEPVSLEEMNNLLTSRDRAEWRHAVWLLTSQQPMVVARLLSPLLFSDEGSDASECVVPNSPAEISVGILERMIGSDEWDASPYVPLQRDIDAWRAWHWRHFPWPGGLKPVKTVSLTNPEPSKKKGVEWLANVRVSLQERGIVGKQANLDPHFRHNLEYILLVDEPIAWEILHGELASDDQLLIEAAARSAARVGGSNAIRALSALLDDARALPHRSPAVRNDIRHRIAINALRQISGDDSMPYAGWFAPVSRTELDAWQSWCEAIQNDNELWKAEFGSGL